MKTGVPPLAALVVTRSEAGLKLLRFLERRLESSARSPLHKWIRTGQVRVNGRRAKAFDLVAEGDEIRVPPFAALLRKAANDDCRSTLPNIAVLCAEKDYLVLCKPGGLPVQGGSGHSDSVAHRLQQAFAGNDYVPAPAHRLDRDTSGLLLAGRNAMAQKRLHGLFAEGRIGKDYLAWVGGAPPWSGPRLLADRLKKALPDEKGREGMCCLPGGLDLAPENPALARTLAEFNAKAGADATLAALSLILPLGPRLTLCAAPYASHTASLLLIRLLSGRKHQIRVQLASRGLPILGDRRYGPEAACAAPLLLHAWRLQLPWPESANECETPRQYCLAPDWPAAFAVDPACLEQDKTAWPAI
ncbi:RluA family pseudouridine synthase [Desulfovibrio sp. OttesenSCG-928-M16]|nr:RluA family pseudouridine synthase [Desulfovibrio sp. OttesenSCG-928-M16]